MKRKKFKELEECAEELINCGNSKEIAEGRGMERVLKAIAEERLEELRVELREERISQGELIELQSLAEHIDEGDVELLQAAGVPEFEEENTIQFTSSWGCIHVDKEGVVKKVDGDKEINGEESYLHNIARVDLEELKTFLKTKGQTMQDHEDILWVAFWDKDGSYEEPNKKRRDEHFYDLTKD